MIFNSPHGATKMLKRADVHIRAPFHLGYGGLIDFQNPGKMLLRHSAGFPELIQGHLGPILGRELIRPCPGGRRHFLPQSFEIPGRTLPLPSIGRMAHFSRPSVRWTERRGARCWRRLRKVGRWQRHKAQVPVRAREHPRPSGAWTGHPPE
jgi:hypothetical protein